MPKRPYTTSLLGNPQDRAEAVIDLLEEAYPEEPVFLEWDNPFQLLVMVILSAQTTDLQVNRVKPALFSAFPDATGLAAAPLGTVEELVRSTGFYKVKARNIVATAQRLVSNFGGEVPAAMEDLLTLPGVGRKTAGVILHHVWGKPAIIVDTHFGRVCRRLGFSSHEDPVRLEEDIAGIVNPARWGSFSMRANQFGRQTCHARKPECQTCFCAELCPTRFTHG